MRFVHGVIKVTTFLDACKMRVTMTFTNGKEKCSSFAVNLISRISKWIWNSLITLDENWSVWMRTIRLFDGKPQLDSVGSLVLATGRKMISMLPRKQNPCKAFLHHSGNSGWLKSVSEQRVLWQWGTVGAKGHLYFENKELLITSANAGIWSARMSSVIHKSGSQISR